MTNTRIPAPKQPQKLEEMLTKIPSFWITGVHITMQFGEVRQSVDTDFFRRDCHDTFPGAVYNLRP